jgi:predicted nucleotidyltransferase
MFINDEILAIKDLIVANSDCEQVYLFGSYAYGTPREDGDPLGPSDYDFYIVLNDNAGNPMQVTGDIEVAFGHMRLALWKEDWRLGQKKTYIPVDFVAGYRSRFEERSKDFPFEHTIAEKGVLLYDKSTVN